MATIKDLATSVSGVVDNLKGDYDLKLDLNKVIDTMVASKYEEAQRASAKEWFLANSNDTQAKMLAVQADFSTICYVIDNYASISEAAALAVAYDTVKALPIIAGAVQGAWKIWLMQLYVDLLNNMSELCLEVSNDIVGLGDKIKTL